MGMLLSVYGAALASMMVLIDNAEGVGGHKAILIILAFFCLTHLFFWNAWFRNSVVFTISQRIREDRFTP